MSAAKFEKLIELIINEDKARAEQLFHEIVVEKSREIYESLMTENPTQDLMDEIENEEQGMQGMTEADEEFETDEVIAGDYDTEDDDMDGMDDMEDEEAMDDMEDEEGMEDEELEDRVVDLEDKIDDLIARFEAEMGADEEMDGEEEEMDGEEEEEEGEEEEEESGLMEEVQLKKVSVTHGDNGVQTKSAGLQNPSRVQTGGAPVKFSGQHESVPTAPKAPSNYATKGEGHLPGAGNFKNAPGKDNFKEKGEAAPKAKHEDPGKSKSPVAVAEGRTKRKVK